MNEFRKDDKDMLEEEKSKSLVEALHRILRSLLVRRLKTDAEKGLLPSDLFVLPDPFGSLCSHGFRRRHHGSGVSSFWLYPTLSFRRFAFLSFYSLIFLERQR